MEFWNRKYLDAPALTSCKLTNQEINLHDLTSFIYDAFSAISGQVHLHHEYKILQKLVRSIKRRFRAFKCMQFMLKVQSSMNAYREFNYITLFSEFANSLPTRYEQETYFPSRNILDYFLVRTQGVCKLIVRILECAKDGYIHWYNQLLLRHNIPVTLVSVGLLARIFIILRFSLRKISELYDGLFKLRPKIHNVSAEWLPVEYEFPSNLLSWLDVDWVYDEKKWSFIPSRRELLSICLFDDEEDIDGRPMKISSADADLEFVAEYMDLEREDRFNKEPLSELQNELDDVHSNTVKLLTNANKRFQHLQSSEDIGVPLNDDAKLSELKSKLMSYNNYGLMKNFIISSSNYFRLLGFTNKQYLNFIELLNMQQAMFEQPSMYNIAKRKLKRKCLNAVRSRILSEADLYLKKVHSI